MIPKRIQRKRTKGWRMPPNTVYVGRGSKWGNPHKVGKVTKTPYGDVTTVQNAAHAVRLFRCWTIGYITARQGIDPPMIAVIGEHQINELKGKNLACWCPLDQPCHADVLLKIANEKEQTDA